MPRLTVPLPLLRVIAGCVLGVLFWVPATPARALETDIGLTQLAHRSWMRSQGALSGMRVVMQMKDGSFFTGGAFGLAAFDGESTRSVHEPQRYPGVDIQSMCIDPAGELWLGFRFGGAYRHSQPADGDRQPVAGRDIGKLHSMACAPDGNVWLAGERGVFQLGDRRWQPVGGEAGLPVQSASGVFVSRDGGVWAVVGNVLYKRAPGTARFVRLAPLQALVSQAVAFAQTPDGALWIGTDTMLHRVNDDSGGALQVQGFAAGRATALLVDSAGSLWVGGEGLRRFTSLAAGAEPQHMTQADGLSGAEVLSLGQDLEGAVWVTTSRGLDRFWSPVFVRLPLPAALDGPKVLLAGQGNTLWIADARYDRVLRYAGESLQASLAIPSPQLGHAARDGTIWFAGSKGVSRIQDDRATTTALPDAARGAQLRAMTQDASGVLWVATDTAGLFRLDAAGWHSGSGVAGLPSGSPGAMLVDANGVLWMGFDSGALARIESGRVRVFDATDGLQAGAIHALQSSGTRLWIAGERALSTHDGLQFGNAPQSRCGPLTALVDLQVFADGAVWLYRPHTVSWMPGALADLQAARNLVCMTGVRDFYQTLGDSLQNDPVGPRVAITADGRIWNVASGRVGWTTRERLDRPVPAPHSRISSLRAGGVNYASSTNYEIGVPAVLPAGTRDLEIDSGAWLFDDGNGVYFRRRLVGQSEHWRENAVRGVVFYSNLRPGPYTFEVQSRTGSSSWGPVARQPITILPYYYETWWFRALLVALALGFVFGVAHRLHRRALARMHERLEVRAAERERIARELHDTLLQGVQGLMLRFQAVALRLPPAGPEAGLMEDVLSRADAVLAEGRDRVAELREPPPDTDDLPEVLAEMLEDMVSGSGIRATVGTTGQVRALDGTVNSDIFLIVREAAANAVRHAECRELRVELSYERFWLRVHVRDDGRGIPEQYLAAGRTGHFGLASMRERARHLRGSLRIARAAGGGTELELRIPASMAYARQREGDKENGHA